MAIAYAGERASGVADTTAQGTVTITFTAATTLGNLLVVLYGGSSGSLITGAITDAKGNTWFSPAGLSAADSATNGAQIIYTFQTVAAYAINDTISFSVTAGPGHTLWKAEEFSGVADVATTHDDGEGVSTTTTTVSVTPGNTGDLIVYQTTGSQNGGWSAGTIGGTAVSGSGSVVSGTATQRTLGWEYLLVGGSGALSCTSTGGTSPASVAAAFKPSGATAAVQTYTPQPLLMTLSF